VAAFVIKSWRAGLEPGPNGAYVEIAGRHPGLFGWLLNLVGIAPTVNLYVTAEKIQFTRGSLEGTTSFVTPLENTCSTVYGYHKPWKEALLIAILFLGVCGLGLILGPLYYFLNKTITVGFTDVGGRLTHINFKRSVIEGQSIGADEAAHVCSVIEALVDARRGTYQAGHAPVPPAPPSGLEVL
jgi:hypothetical protein